MQTICGLVISFNEPQRRREHRGREEEGLGNVVPRSEYNRVVSALSDFLLDIAVYYCSCSNIAILYDF
jgi:hypothetical protein